jgi:predicted hotdog family 3-hydroxylacyl-ACP dehydratase
MSASYPPIEELLPHSDAMLLLETVLEHEPTQTTCSAHIGPDHLFADRDGSVPSWVAIELMAQCAAVHGGLTARRAGAEPRPGLLLGSRRLQLGVPSFAPGQRLRVEASHHRGEAGLVAFDATVWDARGGAPLAEGRINVYLLQDFSELAPGEILP